MRSCCCRVIALSLMLLELSTRLSQAQTLTEPSAPLDLAMPSPHLFANSTGEYLVAAQWFPQKFTYRGETTDQSIVRVKVVDLKKLETIASREFPAVAMRIAVGRGEVYLLRFNERTIHALALNTLQELRSAPLPSSDAGDFLVVADQLLCSADGVVRMELPSLELSNRWGRINSPALGNGSGPLIRSFFGGWIIDGVVYDRELQAPQWVPGVFSLRHLTGSDPNLEEDQSWGALANFSKLAPGLSLCGVVSSDYPVAFEVMLPPATAAVSDVPVTVRVKHIGGALLDSRIVGQIPAELVGAHTERGYGWDVAQVVPSDHRNPLNYGQKSRAGRSEVVTAQWAGNRICTVVGGRLNVWELDPQTLKDLPRTTAVHPATQVIFVEFDQLTRIPVTPIICDGPYEISMFNVSDALLREGHPALGLSNDGILSIQIDRIHDELLNKSIGEIVYRFSPGHDAVETFANRFRPQFQRLLGRPPAGVPYWVHFGFQVRKKGTQNPFIEYGYSVLTDVPFETIKESIRQLQDLEQQQKTMELEKNAAELEQRKRITELEERNRQDTFDRQLTQNAQSGHVAEVTANRFDWVVVMLRICLYGLLPAALLALVLSIVYLRSRRQKK